MNLRTDYTAGRLTVTLIGELDQHEARSALSDLQVLQEEYMPRDLVLDLGELSFMDSSGIALLVRLNRYVKDMGGRLLIENPCSQPRRVIDTAGIDRMIPVATRSI